MVRLHLHRLGKTYRLSKWVLHTLLEVHERQRVVACLSLLSDHRSASIFNRVLTSDEKWVLYDTPKGSKHWLSPQDTKNHPLFNGSCEDNNRIKSYSRVFSEHCRSLLKTSDMNIKEFDPTSPKYEEIECLDEAEILVSSYPNSSKAWILYIIYHLRQGEVNKARAIAKKGIQTINFRKDAEKLNVWKALLNLEARFGTKESLFSVFEDALKYNDKKKTYFHLLELLIDAEKTETFFIVADGKNFDCIHFSGRLRFTENLYIEIEKIASILCTYYMKAGKTKEARNIYNRCLQCVSQKEYPDVMGKFAYLEHEHGDIERSLSLYEEVLVKYPKRKDIKSIYIQILKSQGQEERANALL
ncbi:rRNA biogenesis protein RRP5 [Trichonephila inaurata madagascariensis]|uniref:rRNA biogenesis protein RRP5 n=1 Tax=Trichonephila inaurata madagascariensis TaxID=2747483 RepID=A0A8X6XI27_9ARAC|nr:rRNA biogenesis protein RRP5 [Trichonephila inaurata madagascariensis]